MADEQAKRPSSELNVRGVLWGGVAIALGTVLAALASYLLWQQWSAPLGAPNIPQLAPPVLQSAPQQERAQYFAEKQKLLDSWEWIDRQRGIARIPVEQAMQIMAAHAGAPKESLSDQPFQDH